MLLEDVEHLKATQESAAIQLQSMVTQLKNESLGPHKFGEYGKGFNKSLQGSLLPLYKVVRLGTLGPNYLGWNLSTAT